MAAGGSLRVRANGELRVVFFRWGMKTKKKMEERVRIIVHRSLPISLIQRESY
jgi:hypothetical protein